MLLNATQVLFINLQMSLFCVKLFFFQNLFQNFMNLLHCNFKAPPSSVFPLLLNLFVVQKRRNLPHPSLMNINVHEIVNLQISCSHEFLKHFVIVREAQWEFRHSFGFRTRVVLQAFRKISKDFMQNSLISYGFSKMFL